MNLLTTESGWVEQVNEWVEKWVERGVLELGSETIKIVERNCINSLFLQ